MNSEITKFVSIHFKSHPYDKTILDSNILISNFGINIYQESLKILLTDSQWLDSTIITFSMLILASKHIEKGNPYFITSTFFFHSLKKIILWPHLLNISIKHIQNYLNKFTFVHNSIGQLDFKNIFHFHRLYIPINSSKHWTLAVIDFQVSTIYYFDSYKNMSKLSINLIIYFLTEYARLINYPIPVFKILIINKNIQPNNNDCGVYSILNAFLFDRKPVPYYCKNTPADLRSYILSTLLNHNNK